MGHGHIPVHMMIVDRASSPALAEAQRAHKMRVCTSLTVVAPTETSPSTQLPSDQRLGNCELLRSSLLQQCTGGRIVQLTTLCQMHAPIMHAYSNRYARQACKTRLTVWRRLTTVTRRGSQLGLQT
jgi:hypothetical protein